MKYTSFELKNFEQKNFELNKNNCPQKFAAASIKKWTFRLNIWNVNVRYFWSKMTKQKQPKHSWSRSKTTAELDYKIIGKISG